MPAAGHTAFDLDLKEVISFTVIEPIYHATWFYCAGLRVVAQNFDRHALVDNLADFLARPISQRHSCVVVEATEHNTDLLANLVDEDQTRIGTSDNRRQLSQCLRHQPRLQSGQTVAHITFEFGSWSEGCYRIDDQNIDGVRADQ